MKAVLLLLLAVLALCSFEMTMGEEVELYSSPRIDVESEYIIARPFIVMTKEEREEYFRIALVRMKEKKINLEDVYFSINATTGDVDGLLFHTITNPDAARLLVEYFKYRERKIGKSILPYILNARLRNFVSDKGPRQTLIDYLTYRSSSSALTKSMKANYKGLIDYYRSEGAKLSSEIP